MNANTTLWVTTAIMLVGGLLVLAKGKQRTDAEGLNTVLHGVVPIIAACAYLAMATGQGMVTLPADGGTTRIFYYARYLDWSVTTPLLLLSLALTGMHAGHKRAGLITGAILADVMMIVTAFAFGASAVAWMKWVWFAVSCVAFLGVYYVIWIPQLAASRSERDDVQSGYRSNAAILSVLWFVYPLILAVAPDGLNVVSDATSVLVIAVLDVVAKVAYGFRSVVADEKVTDRDLAVQPGGLG